MNITKSDILKREFQNALLLQNKSENELKDERNRYEQQIERSKNNIKDSLTRLRQYNENKRKLISKIRNIMETASNHEGDLIYNKLKSNKEEEYKREILKFNTLIRTDITRIEEKLIGEERKAIKENKEKAKVNEDFSRSCIDLAIENGRKEILKLTIGFLDKYKLNQESISYLRQLMEEKETKTK